MAMERYEPHGAWSTSSTSVAEARDYWRVNPNVFERINTPVDAGDAKCHCFPDGIRQRKTKVLHIVVLHIVFNNESLNFVGIEQQEAGFVPFGVDFKNPNFAKVAEAMGVKGIRLEEPGDVKNALAEALAYQDGPVVVDAVVDRFALSLPSHVPFQTAKGYTLSMAKQVPSGHMDTVIKTMEHNVRLV
jgi:hypothetical protein